MKFNSKYKKVIVVIFLFLIIFTTFNENFNTVYGKINEEYSQKATAGTIDVEKAIDDAVLIDYFAHFVYVIAGWLESLVMMIIKGFTGVNAFPWADSVIFNTIPFLDVNFLSPAEGSMFKNSSTTIFGDLIKGIYNTIFVLAMAFFGVVVGIMAIKLAISSIASEKAKYKEAIKNWVIAIILLFTTHYLIAFIFFINEKLVEVASVLLEDQLGKNYTSPIGPQSSVTLEDMLKKIEGKDVNEELKETIKKFYDAGGVYTGDFELGGYRMIIEPYSSYTEDYIDHNTKKVLEKDMDVKCIFVLKPGKESERCVAWLGCNKYYSNKKFLSMTEAKTKGSPPEVYFCNNEFNIHFYKKIDLTQEYNKYMLALVQSEYNGGYAFYNNEELTMLAIESAILTAMDKNVMRNISGVLFSMNGIWTNEYIKNNKAINYDNHSAFPSNYTDWNSNLIRENITKVDPFYWRNGTVSNDANMNIYDNTLVADGLIPTGSVDAEHNFVGNIVDYFKRSCYQYERNEEGKLINFIGEMEINAIGAILYSIFVIQSLMFFIAYIKRFFYVIVLALFAPFVILYDFLMKSVA